MRRTVSSLTVRGVFNQIALALPGQRAQFFKAFEATGEEFPCLTSFAFNTAKQTSKTRLVPIPDPDIAGIPSFDSPWLTRWDLGSAEASFRQLFDEGMNRLSSGICQKIVPSVGMRGNWSGDWKLGIECFRKKLLEPSPFYRHGFFSSDILSLGNSPELFMSKRAPESFFETRALAGTSTQADHWNPKLQDEHRWVLEDLEEQLADIGGLETLPQRVIPAGSSLFHLETPLRFFPREMPSAEDLVARLHPTAALGVLPRNSVRLEELYLGEFPRADFGAPLCWQSSKDVFTIWVRIRSVEFLRSGECRCVVGAGLVPGSQFSEEWAEVKNKLWASVEALGLRADQAPRNSL